MAHQVAASTKTNVFERFRDLWITSPAGLQAATANTKTSSIHTTATAKVESIAALAYQLFGLSNQSNHTTRNKTKSINKNC